MFAGRSDYVCSPLQLGCSNKIASILTKLTTFQRHLPQGASTSTILANLSLIQLHDEIAELAHRFDLKFSLYVDDITISGLKARETIEPIIGLIHKYGHGVRRHKIQMMASNQRQIVTGIIVNTRLSIAKEKRQEVRYQIKQLLNQKEVFNYELQSIYGSIGYINSISSANAKPLIKLANNFLPAQGIDVPKPRIGKVISCRSIRKHFGKWQKQSLFLKIL